MFSSHSFKIFVTFVICVGEIQYFASQMTYVLIYILEFMSFKSVFLCVWGGGDYRCVFDVRLWFIQLILISIILLLITLSKMKVKFNKLETTKGICIVIGVSTLIGAKLPNNIYQYMENISSNLYSTFFQTIKKLSPGFFQTWVLFPITHQTNLE